MSVPIAGCDGCATSAGAMGCAEHGFRPTGPPTTPHKCPVCDGSGKVSRPPWIAGDQQTWVSGSIEMYECRACTGTGIVWS